MMIRIFNGQKAKFIMGQNVKIFFGASVNDYEHGQIAGIGFDSDNAKIQYDVKWAGGINKVHEDHIISKVSIK